MTLKWSEQLSVSNQIIDSDHRNLIAMVNALEPILKSRDCSALSQQLELIENWLIAHFENEERIALAVGFDFTKNKLEHQKLLIELQRMTDEINALDGIWPNKIAKQYFQYLCDWITGHVIEEDMLMKPVLQTYDYNFRPS